MTIGQEHWEQQTEQLTTEFFQTVYESALSAVATAEPRNCFIAGSIAQIRFSDDAQENLLYPAIQHVECQAVTDQKLDLAVWSSNNTRFLVDQSPWPAGKYWDRAEILCIRSDRGYVSFDPQSSTVSVYDREHQFASLWISEIERVPIWVSSAPFLKILNWWLADQSIPLCHAAAIGTEDSAVMIVGKSGSGKSTLAVSSLSSQLHYIGDDYVAVCGGESPEVYSLFNSAKLNPDQIQANFSQFNGFDRGKKFPDWEKSMFMVAETHPEKLKTRAKLTAILIPELTDHPQPRISPTSGAVAARALIPSTLFQLPGNTRQKFEQLTNLTHDLPAFDFALSPDLDGNVRAIVEFLARRPEVKPFKQNKKAS